MAAVSCRFLMPAEPPPRLRSKLRRPPLPSPAREHVLQHPFSSFDAPAECCPHQGSHRSITVSSPPSIVSRQCHLLPRHVPVQPPSLLFAEIPLPSPPPPRPSHVELTRGPLRSRYHRMQQHESSHGLRWISGRPSRRTRRQCRRKGWMDIGDGKVVAVPGGEAVHGEVRAERRRGWMDIRDGKAAAAVTGGGAGDYRWGRGVEW
jgi:hypothetical protein